MFDIKNNGTIQSINRTRREIDDNFGIRQKRRDGTAKTRLNSFRFVFTAKNSAKNGFPQTKQFFYGCS